uniref:Regulatory protein zeste n=1 Tax=Bracon brevicornis TaxID=1563983 RepID=A0A6V7LR54_9HYME
MCFQEVTMNRDKGTRGRNRNFTPDELSLLVQLITSYADVIENKKTDGVSVKRKKLAGTSLTNTFNELSSSSGIRVVTAVRSKWDNLKTKAKK